MRAAEIPAAAEAGSLLLTGPGGEALRLDGPGPDIWESLEYPSTADDVVARLLCRYDADRATIEPVVVGLLERLEAHGLIEAAASPGDPLGQAYLGLLKRSVANLLYPELELQLKHLADAPPEAGLALQRRLRDIGEPERLDALIAAKREGTGPIRYAHTMIGLFRLNNIERCAERVFADRIEGDFLEAGVCQGGAAILMRALQRAHGEAARRTWVVDSFEGVPPSVDERDRGYGLDLEEERQPWMAMSERRVRENFARYDLLDEGVAFVPGWLRESLPGAAIDKLAILRVDVDLYSSTIDCLDLLYDKVSPGGFVIVDDYGYLPCCRDAVEAFRAQRGIEAPLRRIDRSGVFWRKP
ncbi:MAG: PqqD family peptide modification chaperone [Allosphingosinicella sp.]